MLFNSCLEGGKLCTFGKEKRVDCVSTENSWAPLCVCYLFLRTTEKLEKFLRHSVYLAKAQMINVHSKGWKGFKVKYSTRRIWFSFTELHRVFHQDFHIKIRINYRADERQHFWEGKLLVTISSIFKQSSGWFRPWTVLFFSDNFCKLPY